MNNFVGVGRLTKAPELRYGKEGTAICTFTVAINRMKKDEADFLNCVCFNKQAENMANFTDKGSQVAVQGSVQTRNYENNEGKRVYVTEILVNRVQFLDSKGKNQNQSGNQNQNQQGNQKPSYQDAYKPPADDPFNGDSEPFDPDGLPF